MANDCTGEHRFFCAEVVACEATGEVHLLSLCTSCGHAKADKFKVAPEHTALRLLAEEKNKSK